MEHHIKRLKEIRESHRGRTIMAIKAILALLIEDPSSCFDLTPLRITTYRTAKIKQFTILLFELL
jgi:hypothetical protein